MILNLMVSRFTESQNKIKVLLCLYVNDLSGANVVARDITYLARSGCDFTVYIPDSPPKLALEFPPGVKIIRGTMPQFHEARSLTGCIKFLARCLRSFYSLWTIMRVERFDVVHVNGIMVFIPAFIARLKRVKLIWHIHEAELPIHSLFRLLLSLSRTLASKIIVPSKLVQALVHSSKTILIANTVTKAPHTESIKDRLRIPQDDLIVSLVGRITPYKGPQHFLEIAERVLLKSSNVWFLMIGEYKGSQEFNRSIQKKVELLHGKYGRVFAESMATNFRSMIHDCDIVMCCSEIVESFSLTVLEAMSHGKLAISSDKGGPRELIENGKSGFLINILHYDQAADLILDLCLHPERRAEVGHNAMERYNKAFSNEIFARRILEVYTT